MSLVIPGSAAPSNLHFAEGTKVAMVESDVYSICEQIAEISPRLFIIEVTDAKGHVYVVMEHCDDGWERQVCKARELDGRVLRRIEEMRAVPVDVRASRIAAELDKEEEDNARLESERIYEEMGGPMLSQLHKDGFTDTRTTSYPLARKKRMA